MGSIHRVTMTNRMLSNVTGDSCHLLQYIFKAFLLYFTNLGFVFFLPWVFPSIFSWIFFRTWYPTVRNSPAKKPCSQNVSLHSYIPLCSFLVYSSPPCFRFQRRIRKSVPVRYRNRTLPSLGKCIVTRSRSFSFCWLVLLLKWIPLLPVAMTCLHFA